MVLLSNSIHAVLHSWYQWGWIPYSVRFYNLPLMHFNLGATLVYNNMSNILVVYVCCTEVFPLLYRQKCSTKALVGYGCMVATNLNINNELFLFKTMNAMQEQKIPCAANWQHQICTGIARFSLSSEMSCTHLCRHIFDCAQAITILS